ncbi:hypothetical protein BDN70DRAFT_876777 [Pholiota conissans]|uniref:Uncharacterized protein n=1 Tax=Pholiota conissans TaxID=109636 RepID=A0A9P5Z6Y6_9AGAR|nr:hypothetical protein BDN70DRAFT_876777 [Pholiota conissans]
MSWPTHFSRDSDGPLPSTFNHRGFFGTTCESTHSCPIDVALWVLLLCIFFLVCWKVYSTNRVGPNSPGQRRMSARDRQCRIELPQPGELLASSQQHYCTYEYKLEGQGDQSHDNVKQENTPILKRSDSIAPTPEREAQPSEKYTSGVGLGITLKRENSEAGGDLERLDTAKEWTGNITTPDPAHVHSPHWGTP